MVRSSHVAEDADGGAKTYKRRFQRAAALPGCTIVSDDFGSPVTPGAKRDWQEFWSRHGVPFFVLGERHFLLLKE